MNHHHHPQPSRWGHIDLSRFYVPIDEQIQTHPPQKRRRLGDPHTDHSIVNGGVHGSMHSGMNGGLNGDMNTIYGTRQYPIMIDSSVPTYYAAAPNGQGVACQGQVNGGQAYPTPMVSGMMHQYPVGEPMHYARIEFAAILPNAIAVETAGDESIPPIRPNDRKSDTYKEQLLAWYQYVERQLEKKTGHVVKKSLGQGGQGRAILLEHDGSQPGPKQVVIKVFAKERDAKVEIDFLKNHAHGHNNLVAMLGNWQPHVRIPGVSVLALEYCDRGSLSHWRDGYRQRKEAVPEGMIWHVAISLARALAFLHSGYPTTPARSNRANTAIVHRDVKPENVLLTHDRTQPYNIGVKLGDFGLAEKLTRDGPQWNDVYCSAGTHDWQPREQVAAPHYAGPQQDMWSLGAIIHFLALGEPPIDMRKLDASLEVNSKIWKASIPRRATRISSRPDLRKGLGHQKCYHGDGHKPWSLKYSIKLNRWMMKMLETNPGERPTAVEVLTKMWDDRPAGCRL